MEVSRKSRGCDNEEVQRPSTIRELRSYLRLINYCRVFFPEYTNVPEPLTNLLKGQTPRSTRRIDPKTLQAFRISKIMLAREAQRTQFNPYDDVIVITDVPEVAVGGVLA